MNDYNQMHALYHHGIKGQKWGVRRYQNEDGTLTEEGKARYGSDYIETAGKISKSIKDASESARQIPTASGHVERGKYPNMTDKELQDNINRMSLEQRYSDLSGDTKYVKSGGEKAKEILQTVGAVAGIGISVATLAKIIYDLRHPLKKTKKGGKK